MTKYEAMLRMREIARASRKIHNHGLGFVAGLRAVWDFADKQLDSSFEESVNKTSGFRHIAHSEADKILERLKRQTNQDQDEMLKLARLYWFAEDLDECMKLLSTQPPWIMEDPHIEMRVNQMLRLAEQIRLQHLAWGIEMLEKWVVRD